MARKVFILLVLGLAVALASSPVQAQGSEKGNKKCNDLIDNDGDLLVDAADPDCGGTEDTEGGKHQHTSLIITFDDTAPKNVGSDGDGPYVDKEGAEVSSSSGPSAPGLRLHLGERKRDDRQVHLEITCVPIAGLDDNCDQLRPLDSGGFGLSGFFPNRTLSAIVRPYEVNCPGGGPCPDIYTQGSTTRLMSYRLEFHNGLFVEIASAIGGSSEANPGRCLSLAPNPTALAAVLCSSDGACNVEVTAFDGGSFTGAGAGDGENDEWQVVANNDTALICDRHNNTVFGKATLAFDFNAIKKK